MDGAQHARETKFSGGVCRRRLKSSLRDQAIDDIVRNQRVTAASAHSNDSQLNEHAHLCCGRLAALSGD